jgi:hypothetical protein
VGHRHPLTGERYGDKAEWTTWDYALMRAVQMIEDFTDKNGLLAWEVDEDGVDVIAVERFDKFDAAVERITSKKGYKKPPGSYFVPKLRKPRGKERFQRIEEWRNTQDDG